MGGGGLYYMFARWKYILEEKINIQQRSKLAGSPSLPSGFIDNVSLFIFSLISSLKKKTWPGPS